jgi:hypothetical protein|tara:strand:- start:228587 stop:228802 length:216 start_codon:yes stop_codon:yes gene_type:complete
MPPVIDGGWLAAQDVSVKSEKPTSKLRVMRFDDPATKLLVTPKIFIIKAPDYFILTAQKSESTPLIRIYYK